MASLTKKCRHPRSSWDSCGCQWLIRQRIGGRDTYAPAGVDREEAERRLTSARRGAQETVAQAVDAWLASKERDPRARQNSLAVYRSRADHVREGIGHLPLRSLRPADLEQLVQSLLAADYAPATVQGIYQVLTASLRHAQRRGVLRALPLPPDGPGIPSVRPRDHGLTLVQVEQVLERMPGRWGKVAELVLLTGLRWGEAVAIREDDITGALVRVARTQNRRGGVNPPKTRQGVRVVPLSRRARALLGDLDLPVGGDYREAREALVAALGELHEPGMGWHTLRNAHATLLDAAGVSLRDAAARMGHGHNYAQTLAYGVEARVGPADALDRARKRHARASSGPSGAAAEPESLDAHRSRRRRAPP